MKYFKCGKHSYGTKVSSAYIILDLKKDRYFFLDQSDLNSLSDLEKRQMTPKMQALVKSGVIDLALYNNVTPFLKKNVIKKQIPVHLEKEIEQAFKREGIGEKTRWDQVLFAWLILMLYTAVLKCGGLCLSFKWIFFLKKRKPILKSSCSKQDVHRIISHLNKAALWVPFNVACLNWSLTCAFLSLWNRIPLDVRIGISLSPVFSAHAWIGWKEWNWNDEKIPYHTYFSEIFSTDVFLYESSPC